ncbi:MAG: hypothetical protein ACSHX7_13985 [Luteolibacter sp.]
MKLRHSLTFFTLIGAGILGGTLLGSFSLKDVSTHGGKGSVEKSIRVVRRGSLSPKLIRSRDTVGSLLSLPPRELYGRLALWLLDADEAGISSFWQEYRDGGGSDYEIQRLVLVNWTRVNPWEVSVDASDDIYLWWESWACHEPHSALAADDDSGGRYAGAIWFTIGQFHSNWLLEHFDEVPEARRENALQGFYQSGSLDLMNPVKVLKMAARWDNRDLIGFTLVSAIRESPLDAWLWLEEYSQEHNKYYGSVEFFFMDADPLKVAEYEQIAGTLPPGEMKRDFESATLELLVKTDPEAALEKARGVENPRFRAEHLAIAGKGFLYSDSERAFQIADELLSACPEVMHKQEISQPDGTVSEQSGERLYKIYGFLEALSNADGERLILSYLASDPAIKYTETLSAISNTWADYQPDLCAAWINQQSDPAIREPVARALVKSHMGQGRFEDALNWAVSLSDEKKNSSSRIFRRWKKLDDRSASEWLDSANLSSDRKEELRRAANR